MHLSKLIASGTWFIATVLGIHAATITDNFSANVNYLTNGVAGTIWDGVETPIIGL